MPNNALEATREDARASEGTLGFMNKQLPEIFCDLNAGATANSYRLTNGSFADLEKLGLTPEEAVGMRFSFNGGADEDEKGQPADIMFDGTIIKDDEWGYVAVADSKGIYWRQKAP